MEIHHKNIEGVILFAPEIYKDERGFFLETFRKNFFEDLGLPEFVQHNQSRSRRGVLRGLHYQISNVQGKLVRCSRGEIYDVAVDLRTKSKTFGKSVGVLLNDKNHHQLWIPPGFAHGFLCLSEIADVNYLCTDFYNPKFENGLVWNDIDLEISWPELDLKKEYIISDKDKAYPTLKKQSKENLF